MKMEFETTIKNFCNSKDVEYFIMQKDYNSNGIIIAIIPMTKPISLNEIMELDKKLQEDFGFVDFAISPTTLYINATE